jgi:cytochrome P450
VNAYHRYQGGAAASGNTACLCDADVVVEAFPLGAQLTVEQLRARPHEQLARLRAREPVSWVPAIEAWLVTRYDLALAVMHDPVTFTVDDPGFSTARVVGPSMLSLDGGAHARNRAAFAGPLRPGAVRERFTALVADHVARLLDALAPAGHAEMRRGFAGPLAAAVLADALGLAADRAPELIRIYDRIVAGVTAVSGGDELPGEASDAFASLEIMLREALGEAEDESVLHVAAGGSDLSAGELVSNAAVLLFGGIETTEGMIANALLALLEHPEAVARARAAPELVEAAVEESLRLEPAAAAVDRYATADTTLGGASISAGQLVRVSLSAANRDAAVFEDPCVRRRAARLPGDTPGPARGPPRAARAPRPAPRPAARPGQATGGQRARVPQARRARSAVVTRGRWLLQQVRR